MLDRYYAPQLTKTSTSYEITGPDAHHLQNVKRTPVGATISLFDGQGNEGMGVVNGIRRSGVMIRIVRISEISRELDFDLTVGCSMPKGDRQRWMIEKATELGVTQIVPLVAEHTVVRSANLGRMRRWVVEASKQCGRNHLMRITTPQSATEFLKSATGEIRLLAQPGNPLYNFGLREDAGRAVALAVGPEGGFTASEQGIAEQTGWELVGLGDRVLRVETAAIVLISLMSFRG